VNRTKILLAFIGIVIIAAVFFLRDFGIKSPDDQSTDSRASIEPKPRVSDSSGDIPSGDPSENSQSSSPSDVSPQISAQKTPGHVDTGVSEGSKSEGTSSTENQGEMQNSAQPPVITPPPQRTFKGIKQSNNDVMVSEIKYTPGDLEDGFVATFQSAGGAKGFDGTVWIIGDYVQRGTTGIMAMPSHSELNLAADGSPSNPKGGLRLTVSGARSESVSRKFSIKRPGFDGEELSQIRIGIYDRSTSKVHIARVSAAELAKKRTTKRVRVDGAN
jgi:hypothetical protein